MMFETIFLAAIFVLGVPYILLGIAAYGDLKIEGSKKMIAAGPWWAFYENNYNESGRNFCRFGKRLVLLSIPVLLSWVFV